MKKSPHILVLALSCATLACGLAAQEIYSVSPRAQTPDQGASAPAGRNPATPLYKFNFRNAPLETVLNYMSEAAGYIIVLDTPVKGTVDMWSEQPVAREEALQLLELALNKNGYAVSVQGRNLIISSKEDAKKRNIPIHTGNDPAEIPPTAEMVMQIIPLRRVDATQAARDLGTLFPSSATVTANQDSNSLIVTDTQINIRHVVEIVSALDNSSDSVSSIRVFQLRNADPVEMAQLLTNLFQVPTQSTTANTGGRFGQFGFGGFGGFGGFRNGGFGGGQATGSPGQGSATTSTRTGSSTSGGRNTPVVAVPDPRTYSVVVTASKDQMPLIAEMVAKLDSSPARKQKVYVYTMQNADVKQVETILKNLFQSSNSRSTGTSTQADPLGSRATSNSQTTSSSTSTLSLSGSSGTSR